MPALIHPQTSRSQCIFEASVRVLVARPEFQDKVGARVEIGPHHTAFLLPSDSQSSQSTPIFVNVLFNIYPLYGFAPFHKAARRENHDTPVVFYHVAHCIKRDALQMRTRRDWARLLGKYVAMPCSTEERYQVVELHDLRPVGLPRVPWVLCERAPTRCVSRRSRPIPGCFRKTRCSSRRCASTSCPLPRSLRASSGLHVGLCPRNRLGMVFAHLHISTNGHLHVGACPLYALSVSRCVRPHPCTTRQRTCATPFACTPDTLIGCTSFLGSCPRRSQTASQSEPCTRRISSRHCTPHPCRPPAVLNTSIGTHRLHVDVHHLHLQPKTRFASTIAPGRCTDSSDSRATQKCALAYSSICCTSTCLSRVLHRRRSHVPL
ncbi:hypothetical protein B0H14DRAFT_655653 [Mycena olivaceomarginata]|nr:hypothetical protein B0H14DRAFT_655653 [Mycena olivaceomarginata]